MKKCPNIPGISIDQHDTIFSINPSEKYLEHSYDDIKYGRISKNPYIEFSIPSLIHPNYAPNGKHVLSCTIQYIPYDLKNQNWNDKLKNEIINNVTVWMCPIMHGQMSILNEAMLVSTQVCC